MDTRVHPIGYGVVDDRSSNLQPIILQGTLACPHMATWSMYVSSSDLKYA
jgi:hypothetical protein